MGQFVITDLSGQPQEVRHHKEIEQLKDLIRAREQKAQSTERYLRMFGRCKPIGTVQMLQRHLQRTIDSIWDMRCQLADMENTPPRTAIDVR